MQGRSILKLAVAGLVVGGWPAAAAAADRPSQWLSKPAMADWYTVWPTAARSAGVQGRAIMRCHIDDDGALSACTVIHEQPSGQGFGAALLSLAPKFRHAPPVHNDDREVVVPADWYEFDNPPDWLRKPTPADLIAVVPRVAAERGIGGKATISCVVTIQGTLNDCVVVSESPPGAGFGGAAIAIAPQLLMKPARKNGSAVLSTVSIPLTWPSDAMIGVASPVGKKVVPPNLAWAEAPTFADVAAAYPEKARLAKVGGHAMLACDMTPEGRLTHCDVARSEPGGYGFDAAAKALAKHFRYEVSTDADRKATRDVSVQLPVTFDPAMLAGAEPVVGKPSWAALPSAALLDSAFAKVRVTGTARAVLNCTVQPGGFVGDCKVASEEPQSAGTGQAALSVAPAFRLATWTTEGLPTIGGQVRIPIRYEGGGPPPDAPAPASK